MIDCHNHSRHSFDAGSSVLEMCRAAQEQGMEVFAITDHCEMNCWEEHNLSTEIPASVAEIETAKEQVPFQLLTGVELGQPLQNRSGAEALLAEQSFDFVIGSLHNTAGDPDFFFGDFVHMPDEEIAAWLSRYYDELLEMVRWGRFDTLAHITYPYRYLNAARNKREIHLFPERFDAIAERIFTALIESGKSLELNASSIMRDEADYQLNLRYFRRYFEMGGRSVTVGSDAHVPGKVGFGIPEAYAMLRQIGFSAVTYYKNCRPVTIGV